ncbi:hypothetical protein D770_02020 [Flammeovirgaceae bacterium 311]|nr:hypothetical protein D770_02020 [Flammeovirgaceae bacterium 311]
MQAVGSESASLYWEAIKKYIMYNREKMGSYNSVNHKKELGERSKLASWAGLFVVSIGAVWFISSSIWGWFERK